jgi:hypothetical protein
MEYPYIFITEGGEQVLRAKEGPTTHDMECIKAGILTVIRLADAKELTRNGTWEDLATAHLIPSDLTDESGNVIGPYHGPSES